MRKNKTKIMRVVYKDYSYSDIPYDPEHFEVTDDVLAYGDYQTNASVPFARNGQASRMPWTRRDTPPATMSYTYVDGAVFDTIQLQALTRENVNNENDMLFRMQSTGATHAVMTRALTLEILYPGDHVEKDGILLFTVPNKFEVASLHR